MFVKGVLMEQKTTQKFNPGCILIAGLLVLAVAAILYAIIFLPLRNNPALVQGMQIIKNDPVVAELFGSPVKQGLIVMANLQRFRDGSGFGSMMTPISGPKNKGEVNFFLNRQRGGDWELVDMSIDIDMELVLSWDASQGFQYH